ncbi:helix-turn-helix domain-containing protein [Lacicoccus alkaliphilus]|uniref:DNA-binding transcriptional regulator, XRE-family HTH domain n=1 Tax=Lacicoccus alkaliphilus DSM 16010 TaxID=1123231 RepID=A0A1M7KQL5_9BACL|nr:helix-turn-helix transcriptional regulator [Salinicoccus alkaliphilus]SHM67731.1 DNA-binding transcriptional regulator, XRE-family HTH domain [Salinicoccus alkaliphilus DSM 16010]
MIGQRIKETRHRNNLTQEELAEGIISRTYLSLIEKGSVQPSTNVLIKLSERLNCSLNDLMSETANFRYNDVEVFREIVFHEYKVSHDEFSTVPELMTKEYEKADEISSVDCGRLHLLYAKYFRHQGDSRKMTHHADQSLLKLSNNVINQFYIDALLIKTSYLMDTGKVTEALDLLEDTYSLIYPMNELNLSKLKILFEIIECYYIKEQYFTCRRLMDKYTQLEHTMQVRYKEEGLSILAAKVAAYEDDLGLLDQLVGDSENDRMILLKCYNMYKKGQIKKCAEYFKSYVKNTDELKDDPLMLDIYNELEERIGTL